MARTAVIALLLTVNTTNVAMEIPMDQHATDGKSLKPEALVVKWMICSGREVVYAK